MKKSTLEGIKQVIRRNPSSILNEDQICLDASFDPDNLSMNVINFIKNFFSYLCLKNL